MPARYSDNLRRKALEAVKRGERKTEVSRMFHISRNTARPVAQTRGRNWRLSSYHSQESEDVGTKSKIESDLASL